MSRMEELNRYYEVWRETNYIYEDWAKQHGTSACCLLTLISIDESEDPCTHAQADDQHGFEGFGKQGVCGACTLARR